MHSIRDLVAYLVAASVLAICLWVRRREHRTPKL